MNRKSGGGLMRGSGPLALALLLVGCTSERDRIDAEAQRLCAIDGGVKVYETVTLPPEKFNEYGQALIPIGKDEIGWGYYESGESDRLIGTRGEPTLVRDTLYVIRTADQKRMGGVARTVKTRSVADLNTQRFGADTIWEATLLRPHCNNAAFKPWRLAA